MKTVSELGGFIGQNGASGAFGAAPVDPTKWVEVSKQRSGGGEKNYISIGKAGMMTVSADIADSLPTYVSLRINKGTGQIAITPSDEGNPNAFKVSRSAPTSTGSISVSGAFRQFGVDPKLYMGRYSPQRVGDFLIVQLVRTAG